MDWETFIEFQWSMSCEPLRPRLPLDFVTPVRPDISIPIEKKPPEFRLP